MTFNTSRCTFWALTLCLLIIYTKNGVTLSKKITVIDFIKYVKDYYSFENLLIVKNSNATIAPAFVSRSDDENNFPVELSSVVHVPMLQMNERITFCLKENFSDLTLSIVYIDGDVEDHTGLLAQFVLSLSQMTSSKVLFLINYDGAKEKLLQALFQFCWHNKIINVVGLFTDYEESGTFFSYTNFPEFRIEEKTISIGVDQDPEIYPYRLGDLHGYRLPYIIGSSEPRIVASLDSDGKIKIGGFVGHFLKAFGKKHNCILFEPLPAKINAFAPARELLEAVRNRTVEISAGLTYIDLPIKGRTYPYEYIDWCILTPVEGDIPHKEFYIMVFSVSAFTLTITAMVVISLVLSIALLRHGYRPDLLDFILSDDCLRGALGQSFTEIMNPPMIVRFIYLQICVLGILLTTWYNSYFSSYVTSAPKERPFRTFEDVLYSGQKVYAWKPELNSVVTEMIEYRKYLPMFHVEPDYRVYLKVRDSFDTKYAYALPSSKWIIINEQQKVFTTPLFRWRDDLCFFRNIPFSFPVHENSIYREPLNLLIRQTFESGLTAYWSQMGFYELIQAGKLHLSDLSRKNEFESMKVEDLHYIWIGMGIMYSFGIFVFICEMFVHYRSNMFERWKMLIC